MKGYVSHLSRTAAVLLVGVASLAGRDAFGACYSVYTVPNGGPIAVASNSTVVAYVSFKFDANQPPAFPPTTFVGTISRGGIEEWVVPIPAQPRGMAVSEDGRMWITDPQFGTILVYSTDRSFASIPVGIDSLPYAITRMNADTWFTTHSGVIGKVSPSGSLTTFPISGLAFDIAADPDRSLLWVANDDTLVELTPSTGARRNFAVPAGTRIYRLAVSRDGVVWFTSRGRNAIGRYDPSTSIFKFFQLPTNIACCYLPEDLTIGPDGRVWFTAPGPVEAGGLVGSIDNSGEFVFRRVHPGSPAEALNELGDIVTGPDGAVWLTAGTRSIVRMLPDCKRRAVRH